MRDRTALLMALREIVGDLRADARSRTMGNMRDTDADRIRNAGRAEAYEDAAGQIENVLKEEGYGR